MNFVNETSVEAGWTLGFQPDGRELLVVAIKGTFTIPEDREEPTLAEQQVPLTEADEFIGEPGASATLYESDYAHRKPSCDILVNGSAYAPKGEPVQRVTVGLHVRPIHKRFEVVGDRVWDKTLLSTTPSPPRPFRMVPISYGCAYGGVDKSEDEPDKVETCHDNPVGIGYYPLTRNKALINKPLPNTQEIDNPVKTTTGKYCPMSFSPISRNFKSRLAFTGTYDTKWLDERAPFFPEDFDYRYFQSAPADQQMTYPIGGEEVVLENLTPGGVKRFRLPRMPAPILFIPHRGEAKQQDAVIDTVLIEPDKRRFMLTWRTSLPLRRNCFEIAQVVVGKTVQAHHRDVRWGTKPHYATLRELVRARKRSQ